MLNSVCLLMASKWTMMMMILSKICRRSVGWRLAKIVPFISVFAISTTTTTTTKFHKTVTLMQTNLTDKFAKFREKTLL